MRILVIGGAGMLGSALVEHLSAAGHTVRSFDRDLSSPAAEGVEVITGDIRSLEAVQSACAGMDAVIHTASLVNQTPGKSQLMDDINLGGTANVITACQDQGVPRLVYTSSVDVVFDGTPIHGGDETIPYPTHHLDHYGHTKMLAEQAVIAANGVRGLATCSLRSAGLYGPGDRHRFPQVIPLVQTSGKLTRIGDGRSCFNHVFIENMAYAHRLAAEQLSLDAPCAGQCYFITEGEPSNFFAFFEPYLKALNIPYTHSSIPDALAMLLARLSEAIYHLSPPSLRRAPLITRYAVAATGRDFWFASDKAARDLGYTPPVSQQEAFERTLAWAKKIFPPASVQEA